MHNCLKGKNVKKNPFNTFNTFEFHKVTTSLIERERERERERELDIYIYNILEGERERW